MRRETRECKQSTGLGDCVSVVHIPGAAGSVPWRVPPVRHVRRLHGTLAGAALQYRLTAAHVRHPAPSNGHRLRARLVETYYYGQSVLTYVIPLLVMVTAFALGWWKPTIAVTPSNGHRLRPHLHNYRTQVARLPPARYDLHRPRTYTAK